MSEVLVIFDEPISDASGVLYFARAMGRPRDDGLWNGWLEFFGPDESEPPLISGRETTQPNRADLEYWAQGLAKVYLEGALARAATSKVGNQGDRAPRENLRDA